MSSQKSNCLKDPDFQDYFDAKLSFPERIRLEKHLKECGCCAKECKAYEALFKVLGDSLSPIPADAPKPSHTEGVMKRISQGGPPAPGPWSFLQNFSFANFRWAPVAGLMAAAWILVLFFWLVPGRFLKIEPAHPESTLLPLSYLLLPESSAFLCPDRSKNPLPASGALEADIPYQLPVRNQTALVFLGENRLEFSRQAQFKVNAFGVHLLSGKTYCSIKTQGKPFTVMTSFGSVTCLGTRFGVEVTPQGVLVTLDQGKIELKTKMAVETLTDRGEMTMTPDGKLKRTETKPSPPGTMTAPPVLSGETPAAETGSGPDSLSNAY